MTSYVPPQCNSSDTQIAPSLKRKGSAPELSTRLNTSDTVHLSVPAQAAQRSASVSSTPVLRPIAIPAFKGLSFLTGRSRSTPPIPRASKPSPSARPTPSEAGDQKQKYSPPINTFSDEKLPEIVLPDVPAAPIPAFFSLPAAVPLVPGGQIDDTARMRQGASAVSHTPSPGPSLSEALLRARRPATPHLPRTPPAKGTRFKTSFIGVADHVLRLEEQNQQQQNQVQTSGDLEGNNRDGDANLNGGSGGGPEPQGEE